MNEYAIYLKECSENVCLVIQWIFSFLTSQEKAHAIGIPIDVTFCFTVYNLKT